jgi:hypothetical protein
MEMPLELWIPGMFATALWSIENFSQEHPGMFPSAEISFI